MVLRYAKIVLVFYIFISLFLLHIMFCIIFMVLFLNKILCGSENTSLTESQEKHRILNKKIKIQYDRVFLILHSLYNVIYNTHRYLSDSNNLIFKRKKVLNKCKKLKKEIKSFTLDKSSPFSLFFIGLFSSDICKLIKYNFSKSIDKDTKVKLQKLFRELLCLFSDHSYQNFIIKLGNYVPDARIWFEKDWIIQLLGDSYSYLSYFENRYRDGNFYFFTELFLNNLIRSSSWNFLKIFTNDFNFSKFSISQLEKDSIRKFLLIDFRLNCYILMAKSLLDSDENSYIKYKKLIWLFEV